MTERRTKVWQILERATQERGAAILGICNVTPDSFSDGGAAFAFEDACRRVDLLLDEGADFLDIGGESTRPGAVAVPVDEQLRRVLPVVRYAVSRGALVSVDTTHGAVAGPCLDAGACVINDVSCLSDAHLARLVAQADAVLLLMHSRPHHFDSALVADAKARPSSGSIADDVLGEWLPAAERARAEGLPWGWGGGLLFDPGLGFAKTADESWEVLRRWGELVAASPVPVALGASRKSFLQRLDPKASAAERVGASVAAACWAVRHGAVLVRVHDVRATAQALALEARLRPLGARTYGPGKDRLQEADVQRIEKEVARA